MAAVSLAMPTKLWDSAGRECGRTFLYLHFFHLGFLCFPDQFACYRTQFLTDLFKDPFLSSVCILFMV